MEMVLFLAVMVHQINPGDLVYLGTTNARYTYGFDLGAYWKGFDFSIFFQGACNENS